MMQALNSAINSRIENDFSFYKIHLFDLIKKIKSNIHGIEIKGATTCCLVTRNALENDVHIVF